MYYRGKRGRGPEWILFDEWLLMMQKLGYIWEIVYFNSMFAHPTPQSRDRMYVVFWKKGNTAPDLRFTPLAWCAYCGKDVASIQSWKNPLRNDRGVMASSMCIGALSCFCQVNCEPIFDRNSHQFQREAGERRNENGTIFQLKSEPAFAMDINDN